ncbi:MAG: glycosyltransferase family 4 protein [Verrucomicrobia bacterium]|nr:glycosyltransferase family 4 protein [Verrucomicrobiota bacterium]
MKNAASRRSRTTAATDGSFPRVLHLVPALFDRDEGTLGGAERYVFELASHMAAAGVPTTLLACGPRERDEIRADLGGLRIRVLSGAWRVRGQRQNPFSPRLLPELLRADVIHCHQTHVLASSLAALAGRLTRKRVFTTDLGGGGWDISGYVSTDRWYHGHLHISEYSRRVSGHAESPCGHVILGGVDGEKFSPAPEDPAISDNAPALFVGRLFPHKGVDDLIAATVPAGPPLEIIGRPYDAAHFELLKRLAAGRPVTFRTECSDDELIAAYRRALCIVLPSVYRPSCGSGSESLVPELLGQTLLEGMACARPAICTRVASMPEIVVDVETGFIVPPNDPAALQEKIRWLRDHPDQAKAMGAAGRRRALTEFSWPAVVARCLAIYRGEKS